MSTPFAGNVNIDSAILQGAAGYQLDITNQLAAIEIFEDLYTPFLTGTLIVTDSIELQDSFPLLGEEFVQIKVTTPGIEGKKLSGTYYVYKMSDRIMTADKGVMYQLHFIMAEAVVDLNKRISHRFSGTPSEIAQQLILDKTIGLQSDEAVYAEATNNRISYLSNNWSPVRNMKYLCENAVNSLGDPTYLFYHDRVGFNFRSLSDLFQQEPYQYFVKDNYTRDITQNGGTAINLNEQYRRINDIKLDSAFDYMSEIRDGGLTSNQYAFDLISKNVSILTYDSVADFKGNVHMNPFSLNSNSVIYQPKAKIITRSQHYDNFTGFGDSTNTAFIQRRIARLQALTRSPISLYVPGRVDYTVGQMMNVEIPRTETVRKGDTVTDNETLSGNYLVGAIRHFIGHTGHECAMSLIKESSARDPNKAGV